MFLSHFCKTPPLTTVYLTALPVVIPLPTKPLLAIPQPPAIPSVVDKNE